MIRCVVCGSMIGHGWNRTPLTCTRSIWVLWLMRYGICWRSSKVSKGKPCLWSVKYSSCIELHLFLPSSPIHRSSKPLSRSFITPRPTVHPSCSSGTTSSQPLQLIKFSIFFIIMFIITACKVLMTKIFMLPTHPCFPFKLYYLIFYLLKITNYKLNFSLSKNNSHQPSSS